eukprot:981095-Pyramimonas_sp.AAC.1
MRGYSLAAITFYGFCSDGFAGRNLTRYAKLGALVSQLRLPWFIVGGFNLEPEELARRGFPSKTDGVIYKPSGVLTTCESGKGALLDFVIASQ